jgi:hypothetical protein
MTIRRELIDELLKEYETPQDILGEDGLLKELTKAVVPFMVANSNRSMHIERSTMIDFIKTHRFFFLLGLLWILILSLLASDIVMLKTATPTPTPVPQGTNLLQNPSFETGIIPWFININNGAGTLTRDTTTVAPGAEAASAHMAVTQSLGHSYDISVIQQNLALTAGQQYIVSFWAKADTAGRQLQAGISQAHSPNFSYSGWQPFTLSTSWQQYSFMYIQSTPDNNTELSFASGQSTGSVWLDNVSLTPGTSTSTNTPVPPTP